MAASPISELLLRGADLHRQGRLQEAEAHYRQVLAQAPRDPDALHNLGEALTDLHQLDEAIASYRQALAIRPDYAEAHFGLAFALLRRGAFREGFAEYEWRWQLTDATREHRQFAAPPWDGTHP